MPSPFQVQHYVHPTLFLSTAHQAAETGDSENSSSALSYRQKVFQILKSRIGGDLFPHRSTETSAIHPDLRDANRFSRYMPAGATRIVMEESPDARYRALRVTTNSKDVWLPLPTRNPPEGNSPLSRRKLSDEQYLQLQAAATAINVCGSETYAHVANDSEIDALRRAVENCSADAGDEETIDYIDLGEAYEDLFKAVGTDELEEVDIEGIDHMGLTGTASALLGGEVTDKLVAIGNKRRYSDISDQEPEPDHPPSKPPRSHTPTASSQAAPSAENQPAPTLAAMLAPVNRVKTGPENAPANDSVLKFGREYLAELKTFINERAKTDYGLVLLNLTNMPQPEPSEISGGYFSAEFIQGVPDGDITVEIRRVDPKPLPSYIPTSFKQTYAMPKSAPGRRGLYKRLIISAACVIEDMLNRPTATSNEKCIETIQTVRKGIAKKFLPMTLDAFEHKLHAFRPILNIDGDDQAAGPAAINALRKILEKNIYASEIRAQSGNPRKYKLLFGGLNGMDEPYPVFSDESLETAPEDIIYCEFRCSKEPTLGEYAQLRIHVFHDSKLVDVINEGPLCKPTHGQQNYTAMALLLPRAIVAVKGRLHGPRKNNNEACEAAKGLRKRIVNSPATREALKISDWNVAFGHLTPIEREFLALPRPGSSSGSPLHPASIPSPRPRAVKKTPAKGVSLLAKPRATKKATVKGVSLLAKPLY